ncbi:MAG: hypothetical protein EBR59_00410 [Methylococcaceae bacterium]|jgi:LPS-assembly lipoprotein|nr:hypothetical protein [Methylococcaceae bacterium]
MKKPGLLLMFLLLTACGYHMRGSIAMPESLKSVYVFNASSALQSELTDVVKASKGRLVSSPSEAGLVIKIVSEELKTRVLSIGSTGKSNESELDYFLQFQFYDNQENQVMEEQRIEIAREYFNDQTAVLAKLNEEQIIRKEIYKQAVRMLLLRAEAAAAKIKK